MYRPLKIALKLCFSPPRSFSGPYSPNRQNLFGEFCPQFLEKPVASFKSSSFFCCGDGFFDAMHGSLGHSHSWLWKWVWNFSNGSSSSLLFNDIDLPPFDYFPQTSEDLNCGFFFSAGMGASFCENPGQRRKRMSHTAGIFGDQSSLSIQSATIPENRIRKVWWLLVAEREKGHVVFAV